MKLGVRLNPLDPRSALYFGYLARAYLSIGEPESALVCAQRAVALRRNDPEMYLRLAACTASLNDRIAAEGALKSCENLEKGFLARKRDWRPYSDTNRNDAFFEGLRRLNLI
jgi:predicted Zn-dependent protease